MFTVAIVGRANVGKTTLFNRLINSSKKVSANKKDAIVADFAGTTRDRNEVIADFFGLKVKFVDSAGIELANVKKKDIIEKQMLDQAITGLQSADLCLFVIDGIDGVLPNDVEVFNILRKNNKNVVLVINKSENFDNLNLDELYQLHCERVIHTSSAHNLGLDEIYNIIKEEYEKYSQKEAKNDDEIENNEENRAIRIAILGRPNAGKSTLINNLLKQNRMIVSDVAGTTRDKVEVDFQHNGQNFAIIDTAGIRKKFKNGDFLEQFSVEKSLEALQFADIAVVVMDITQALEEQDLTLCQRICNDGRILMICFNKWDLVDEKIAENLIENLKETIRQSLAQVKGIIFFTCSAKNDQNLTEMLDDAKTLYQKWNCKLSSSQIAREIENETLPTSPIVNLKIKYINQVKMRPPTFIAFSLKNEKKITNSSIENLKNWIYKHFDILGIPIRLSVRGKKK